MSKNMLVDTPIHRWMDDGCFVKRFLLRTINSTSSTEDIKSLKYDIRLIFALLITLDGKTLTKRLFR